MGPTPSAKNVRMADAPVTEDVTEDDHALAAQLATEAGELLLGVRVRGEGLTRWELGDEGDWEAHKLLVSRLAELRPGDAVLSEEGREDPARLQAARVWIVDPLDGTREFSEIPRSDWAVHVALVVDRLPVAGAVALPARGFTLATHPAPVLPPPVQGPPRMVVSRSRPPREAELVAGALQAKRLPLGSAGAKAMAVVLGDADIYVHAGGQYEWDSAAPVAVAQAAGLHASRLDGSPLIYNQPDPYLPDLLICRPELAAPALAALGH
jgi:3'(2'), 5'-bisphosphate nucleotidase